MSVRAKFKVSAITLAEHGTSIQLNPVTSGSQENEKFYRYTPGGKIELTTVNQEAAKQFEVGGECYVDFTPVPKAK